MTRDEEKLNFIKGLLDFTFEDLTQVRQFEFLSRPETKLWKYCALSEDNLGKINQYGFRLWNQPDFRQKVNNKLKVLEETPLEELQKKVVYSTKFEEKEKEINCYQLAHYLRSAYEWIDNAHIQSKITKKVFVVVGGKEKYRELFGDSDMSSEYYRYNKSKECWEIIRY